MTMAELPTPSEDREDATQALLCPIGIATMVEAVTPRELAQGLGVSARAVRKWLRDQLWQTVRFRQVHLTAEQAAQARAHIPR